MTQRHTASSARVRQNIVANYAGGIWSALMGFAFVPFYIRYLGIEAYGLIGLYASLQIWFAMLDFGLSPALSREMARYRAGAHSAQSIWLLFRSLETIYLLIALCLAGAIIAASSSIAANWLKVEHLAISDVANALILIGITIALRWLGALYRGALIGLQRQVWLSVCNAAFATLRGVGALLVLAWISPSLGAFFVFQVAVGVFELLVLALGTRRMLPPNHDRRRFSFNSVKEVLPFAGGMAGITLLSILLTQIDKILLSKLLTLSQFGYYTLAYTAASVLLLLTTPVGNAAYPKLTELITEGNSLATATTYHGLAQILAVVLGPPAVVMAIFPSHVMLLWTNDRIISEQVAPIFSILVIGNLLNGLMHMPYNLQLAHGWTRFTVRVNMVALTLLVPSVYFGVQRYGTSAAAVVWLLLNAGYILIAVPLMHRVILPLEKRRWYIQDVIMPLGAVVAVVSVVKSLVPMPSVDEAIRTSLTLLLTTGAGFVAAILAVSRFRRSILEWFNRAS